MSGLNQSFGLNQSSSLNQSRCNPGQSEAGFPGEIVQILLCRQTTQKPCLVSGGYPLFQAVRDKTNTASRESRPRICAFEGSGGCTRSIA